MEQLFQILTYPIGKLAALLMSLEVADGVSFGALMVSAALLVIIFRALVGIHLSVFSNRPGPSEEQEVERARHRLEINKKARGE